MSDVKQVLFDEYGCADGRFRADRCSLFFVDDRSDADFGADQKLYPWFVAIAVRVVVNSEVTVTISGIEWSRDVARWAEARDIKAPQPFELTIRSGDQAQLSELASLIAAIVDRPYRVPSYKHTCPRTAKSLRRLRTVLDRAWLPGTPAPPEAGRLF
jgi:hypothetical protein